MSPRTNLSSKTATNSPIGFTSKVTPASDSVISYLSKDAQDFLRSNEDIKAAFLYQMGRDNPANLAATKIRTAAEGAYKKFYACGFKAYVEDRITDASRTNDVRRLGQIRVMCARSGFILDVDDHKKSEGDRSWNVEIEKFKNSLNASPKVTQPHTKISIRSQSLANPTFKQIKPLDQSSHPLPTITEPSASGFKLRSQRALKPKDIIDCLGEKARSALNANKKIKTEFLVYLDKTAPNLSQNERVINIDSLYTTFRVEKLPSLLADLLTQAVKQGDASTIREICTICIAAGMQINLTSIVFEVARADGSGECLRALNELSRATHQSVADFHQIKTPAQQSYQASGSRSPRMIPTLNSLIFGLSNEAKDIVTSFKVVGTEFLKYMIQENPDADAGGMVDAAQSTYNRFRDQKLSALLKDEFMRADQRTAAETEVDKLRLIRDICKTEKLVLDIPDDYNFKRRYAASEFSEIKSNSADPTDAKPQSDKKYFAVLEAPLSEEAECISNVISATLKTVHDVSVKSVKAETTVSPISAPRPGVPGTKKPGLPGGTGVSGGWGTRQIGGADAGIRRGLPGKRNASQANPISAAETQYVAPELKAETSKLEKTIEALLAAINEDSVNKASPLLFVELPEDKEFMTEIRKGSSATAMKIRAAAEQSKNVRESVLAFLDAKADAHIPAFEFNDTPAPTYHQQPSMQRLGAVETTTSWTLT